MNLKQPATTPQRSAQELHDAIIKASQTAMPAAIVLLMGDLQFSDRQAMATICGAFEELTKNLRPASDFE